MGAAHFLLISERPDDLEFGEFLSSSNNLTFHLASTRDEVRYVLTDFPQTIVFWDATAKSSNLIAGTLQGVCSPHKVFAITDEPLNAYPELFKVPAFGHHVFRRYLEPAPRIYSRLVAAALTPYPFGLARFFPDSAPSNLITLKKSGQRKAAMEASQNVLRKLGLPSRVASSTAQAIDELLMNAMFDAPVDNKGVQFRKKLDRQSEFDLLGKDQVELELAWNDIAIGIRVGDNYGSLTKEQLLAFLSKNYQESAFSPAKSERQEKGAGLGLYGITQSGLSVLFVSKPQVRTEVILIVPRAPDVRQFRSAFRFLSILGGDAGPQVGAPARR